jgi:hypothetical protein
MRQLVLSECFLFASAPLRLCVKDPVWLIKSISEPGAPPVLALGIQRVEGVVAIGQEVAGLDAGETERGICL